MAGKRDQEARHRVGAAAAAAGVGVQTLRYYERRGLVAPRTRTGAGYREYGPKEIRRIRAIKRAQSLGFTLREILELIGLARGRAPARRVAAVARQKLEDIDEKIRSLEQMRAALKETVEACDCAGDLTRCVVIDGLGDPSAANDEGSPT